MTRPLSAAVAGTASILLTATALTAGSAADTQLAPATASAPAQALSARTDAAGGLGFWGGVTTAESTPGTGLLAGPATVSGDSTSTSATGLSATSGSRGSAWHPLTARSNVQLASEVSPWGVSPAASVAYSTTALSHPVAGGYQISSVYGWRDNPTDLGPQRQFHIGQDYAAACGTPVLAAADGVVIAAGWNGSGGQRVDVDHGDGLVTAYRHHSMLLVQPGDQVSRGDVIGLVGSTGNSTGCHLHFDVRLNGTYVNPVHLLPGGEGIQAALQDESPRVTAEVDQDTAAPEQVLDSSQDDDAAPARPAAPARAPAKTAPKSTSADSSKTPAPAPVATPKKTTTSATPAPAPATKTPTAKAPAPKPQAPTPPAGVKPTTPATPAASTEDPTKGTQPTTPAPSPKPTVPAEPAPEPQKPEPTKPEPTTPAQPVEPTEPTQPTPEPVVERPSHLSAAQASQWCMLEPTAQDDTPAVPAHLDAQGQPQLVLAELLDWVSPSTAWLESLPVCSDEDFRATAEQERMKDPGAVVQPVPGEDAAQVVPGPAA